MGYWTGTALDTPSIMCLVRGRMERLFQEHKAERATGARFIRPCMTGARASCNASPAVDGTPPVGRHCKIKAVYRNQKKLLLHQSIRYLVALRLKR